MTDAQTIWFGVIAVAIVTMAVVQVATVIVLVRTAREVSRTAVELRQAVRPLIDKVNRIADDAARGTALAVVQIERIDKLVAGATEQFDETLRAIRQAVVQPVQYGSMIMTALKTLIVAFRRPSRRAADDEDPLFVG